MVIPSVVEHAYKCVSNGVYDGEILGKYTAEEWAKIDSWIDHDRDMLFTYAGLRQVVDKYLVQDRSSGNLYETPQYMYMMIAVTLFQNYPKETRLDYVKRYYNAISKHKINIPTPIMAGVRTPLRQFASCVLVDSDDTLDSIFTSDMAIGRYVAQRAGIGINAGRIRGINAKSEAEKFSTQALSLSSKSLKRLSDAALKMALEVDRQRYTSQSGTKK
jgi:ribonucleoside-diphosphate reductase alpha chain